MSHKEWCDFLSTMDKKYNRKQAADQVKILAAYKEALANYDSDTSENMPLKKKARNGVLPYRKKHFKKTQIIKVNRVTACCARRLELLSASINHIAHKIALEEDPTRNPSGNAW